MQRMSGFTLIEIAIVLVITAGGYIKVEGKTIIVSKPLPSRY